MLREKESKRPRERERESCRKGFSCDQRQRTHSAVLHFPFPPLLSNLPALRMDNFRCQAFHVWIPEALVCR